AARGVRRPAARALRPRVELVGLRRPGADPDARRRPAAAGVALRRDQDGGRTARLLVSREPRAAGGGDALLHGVRPAAAPRHGVSPLHPRRVARRSAHALRRRRADARLHVRVRRGGRDDRRGRPRRQRAVVQYRRRLAGFAGRGDPDHRADRRPPADDHPRTRAGGRHARHLRRHLARAQGSGISAGSRTRGRDPRGVPLARLDSRTGLTRMTNILRVSAVLALAVLVGACASGGAKKPPTGTPEPDKFLFDRGSENLGRKRWIVAREYFRQLVDSYPQSKYRADAKLGIGDTYMGERSAESYVLAINEFREFLNFYPTSPRAHYAQFKLAMAHFNQMRSPMRDQTETRDAIRELQAYITK